MKKVLIVVSVGLMTMTSSAFADDCDKVRSSGLRLTHEIFLWKKVLGESVKAEKDDQADIARFALEESLDLAAKYASIYNAFCKD